MERPAAEAGAGEARASLRRHRQDRRRRQAGPGLAIDYQIITEIRAFEVSTEGADTAVVEIFAKILNDRNGTVRAQKAFRATAGVKGAGNPAFIKAIDQAFAGVSAEIVSWTLGTI